MRVSEKMVWKSITTSGPSVQNLQGLNKLRKHNDIRFEIKKLEKTSDKVFLLIQVCNAVHYQGLF